MFWSASFLALPLLSVSALPSRGIQPRCTVSNETYDDLVYYLQYASSAYLDECASPNGNTLVQRYDNETTDTQAFLARDDTKGEIVIVFRGSSTVQDLATDGDITLVDLNIQGVNAPVGTQVHHGFHTAWNSIVGDVIITIQSELASHPNYTLATSGHSLGGALSSLGGITLQQNFPDVPLKMYTFGQPRTGNPSYAYFVDSKLGSNIFRGVHGSDGVPTMISQDLGYQHHGVEYFQSGDPPSAGTTKACIGNEDPTCSASIPSSGINMYHLIYYDITVGTAFCD
ncbi:alpha/beta-hydrolase [Guyanagaster necrorhizus]|uniref:Alpha/beta-hydrolase n=1 Tax=Guyanagaster necrorhizus TaxID=856835 RepID=A0A9P8ASN8_9AGAR|nr:alpha/beta-hydrolase [Guyanagaster necrorhizus MCA 3950]KAG7445057.1 alpha/beta-hydrolase [Guyanagaster necrorhizus MCA 3950]